MSSLSHKQVSKLLITIFLLILGATVGVAEIGFPTDYMVVGYAGLLTLFGVLSFLFQWEKSQVVNVGALTTFAAALSLIVLSPSDGVLFGYDQYTTLRLVRHVLEGGLLDAPATSFRGSFKIEDSPILFTLAAMLVRISGSTSADVLMILPVFVVSFLAIIGYRYSRWKYSALLWTVPGVFVFFIDQAVGQSLGLIIISLLALLYPQSHSSRRLLLVVYGLLCILPFIHAFSAIIGVCIVTAIEAGRFLRGESVFQLTSLTSVIIVLTAWMTSHHRLFESLSLVFGYFVGVLTGVQVGFPSFTGSGGAAAAAPGQWITIGGISKHLFGWFLYASRGVLFGTLGILFLFVLIRRRRAAFSPGVSLFGVGSVLLLGLYGAFGGVNANRILLLMTLFATAAITDLKDFLPAARVRTVLKAVLIVVVISHMLYLPPAVFSPDATPASYVSYGRPVYHSQSTAETADFIGTHGIERVEADTVGLLVETQYSVGVKSTPECFVGGECAASTVWWLTRYEKTWQSRSTGLTTAYPDGSKQLSQAHSKVYTSGDSSLFEKTMDQA